ncbi:hypothetical protein Pmani_019761 [Petrolisthes manimaculis]|uniref:Uncharacterized protein n=1 Tax=Petrolisthes manimaculis TaxID=1843537 RepID=A0AAE1U596_9EUCA|nr:hypothetical protein Pmani_019761 [Petrolisthes manimaculis]
MNERSRRKEGELRARLRGKRKEEKNEEKRITLMMVEEERRLADHVGLEEGSREVVVEEVMPPIHEVINQGSTQSQQDGDGQVVSVKTNWMLQSTRVSLSQEVTKAQGSRKGQGGHGFLDTDSLDYADAVEVRII